MKHIKGVKLGILLPILVGAVLIFGLGAVTVYSLTSGKAERLQAKYNLLARRALSDNPSDLLLNFFQLKTKLHEYFNENSLNDTSALYFEYLPTGTSIGINEDRQLVGASLLKTPLAINLYKAAEQGKIDLNQKVTLKKEWLDSNYGTLYQKGAGYSLTLREATKIMLEQSDNTAALAIYDTLSQVVSLDINLLNFIDIDYSVNKDETVKLGPESYSNILKCLYFSCYLNKDSSQELLGYLLQADDSSRLKLYLPDDIKVAHKIGTFDEKNQMHIQSDCGIVYVQKRNYLLCVMVEGDDPAASKIIGEVSQMVYEQVNNKAPSK